MKLFLSFFLLWILVAPSLLTWGWMQWHRLQVRSWVKATLLGQCCEDELLLLRMPVDEAQRTLRWLDESEFELAGQRYDLVKKSRSGDTLLLLVWPDHLETGLSHQLDSLLGQSADPIQHHRQKQLLDFFKSLGLPDEVARPSLPSLCQGKIWFEQPIPGWECAPLPPVPPPEV